MGIISRLFWCVMCDGTGCRCGLYSSCLHEGFWSWVADVAAVDVIHFAGVLVDVYSGGVAGTLVI